jgi:nucleosome assembly protein 1-like 1
VTIHLLCPQLTIQEQVGYGGDFVYDKAVGDEIKWKEGKNLTVQTEIKKQRNKSESPFL